MWRKGVWRATATPRLQMSCYSFILNIVLLLCLAFSFYFTSCKHYKCRPSSITTNGNKHFHTTKEFYEVDENVNLLNYQDKKSYSKNSVYQKKIFKQISLKQKIYPDLNECQTRPLRPLYYQRGQYWVLENYIPADRSFLCNQSITYTTHGDYTFLGNLELLISRWQGPVSMALYAPDADFEYTLDILVYLRNCRSQDIKTYVTFHIFFDVLHTPKIMEKCRE
ncbi:uncharacterized protein LOC121875262 [Homarus americanus]|uniref:uncharacterized protein LOC121875262 n=1 Tax=Homarus americanus TaxID=6706 RepID=UPI001C462B5C|nr:uncharacterized protein LOC121875262 [Homarus americanus]